MSEGADVHVVADTDELITNRLRLRPWTSDDADAALAIFGRREVARWLTPAVARVADRDGMQLLLARWITEHDGSGRPLGHWAIEIRDSGLVIGAVALLPLPPRCTDLEIGWQLTPAAWGHGYGAEAGHAVAHHAFAKGVSEVFAVVRLGNTRGVATARRVGMQWVGETDNYYGLTMQVYRLAAPDLDYPENQCGYAPILTAARTTDEVRSLTKRTM
ncbi:GNAT family N-acetyltransferase [Mycobacterium sp. URHB0021]|jgi:RimJ/RimL family protein N-acetyltransferase